MHRPYFYVIIASLWMMCLTACRSSSPANNKVSFQPLLNKEYAFSVLKTSEKQWTYDNVDDRTFDTIEVNFTLKSIKYSDSGYTCEIKFKDYKVKLPPFGVTFTNVDITKPPAFENPFTLLDSLGDYLQGAHLKVEISNTGTVKKVYGVDDLMIDISKASHSNAVKIKGLLSDYLSANAIADMLNSAFAILPNKKIITGERWRTKHTLVNKAPIEVTNDWILHSKTGDSMEVSFTSTLFSKHAPGDEIHLKGNQAGRSVISCSTGLPYSYESASATITTTKYYNVTQKEQFTLKLLHNL